MGSIDDIKDAKKQLYDKCYLSKYGYVIKKENLTEDELYNLCHYTNLQPLWSEDNIKKSNKIL